MTGVQFTTVIGVDANTIDLLKLTWPTWCRHKPDILRNPLVVFYDRDSVDEENLIDIVGNHPHVRTTAWPFGVVRYEGDETIKWFRPQRMKMLAGFVYVPASYVTTEYWLKLDVDAVAMGCPEWIKDEWFQDNPAIIAPPWSYTKPARQMMDLDYWVAENDERLPYLAAKEPLNIIPAEGAQTVRHRRIASWCAFFGTGFTKLCASYASVTAGHCRLPVPSQDGYMFYVAKRSGFPILPVQMKALGWAVRGTKRNIRSLVEESLASARYEEEHQVFG